MNRIELEASIAEKTNLNKKVVTEVIQAFLDITTETLSQDEPIRLTGFATISVKERAERMGKNPKTGESILIPSSKRVAIKGGKDLVAAING